MKASYRDHYCPPAQIQLKDIPKPTPKGDEVLVRVMATTVNRTDVGVATGKPYAIRAFAGLSRPKIPVTGTDFAGVIEAVGSEVQNFKIGDRVWGFDDNGAGTHAEWVAYSTQKALLKMPENRDFTFMVACAEAAHYAVNFINKVQLEAGMGVLVNGGTGAIGSAAIQILKAMGIAVTAVCFEKDQESVKNLGPDRVIALEKTDFTKEDKVYDFVFDAVGKSRFTLCMRILKPHGVYISSELGPNWENIWLALAGKFSSGKKVIFPLPTDILGSMQYIQNLVEKGKFQPLLDPSIFSPEQISEAFSYVASGKKTGNLIINWD
ncbi:MAG: NAD(P)-dependent alcohol dehydrogenase [Algoriphagus aquaeductus]|uniref:NAD(P)-dependent alcohol dehydrogenase n=1 Tax=Algoriphagus aquaeductus TaxID=475299 RepID=UPI00391CF244